MAFEGFRVTCLLSADENHGEEVRVLATSRRFLSRESAERYLLSVAPGREPRIEDAAKCDAPHISELRLKKGLTS